MNRGETLLTVCLAIILLTMLVTAVSLSLRFDPVSPIPWDHQLIIYEA